jgi:arylsulfatase A-like enzyme
LAVPKVPDGYLDTLPTAARKTLTVKQANVNLSPDIAREAMQAYYASISFLDAQVGRVLAALERLGLDKNTIVLLTSDHGYHMGEHGHYQKMTLYENATHVPLVIAVPGMKTAGQSTASIVEMVDYYPTLAELCGLAPPASISGTSQAAVLEDPASRPRESALSEHRDGYALRTDRYRYVEWGPEARDGAELYDHTTDPAEMVNLAGRKEHAQVEADLSRKLRERIASAQRPPEGVKQVRLTPEQERQRREQNRQAQAK